MSMRKKPKLEIKDISGKRISFKKLKEEHRDIFLQNAISKKDVIKREILTKWKLEKAVKGGLIKEIIFDKQVYFDGQELMDYVKRTMGFSTGGNQVQNNILEIEGLYKEKRKLWEKEHDIDKRLKVLTKDTPIEERVYKFIGISIDVYNLTKDNKFCGWEIDKYFMSRGLPPDKKLDLKVVDEAIRCLEATRVLYEKHENEPEFKEILNKKLDDFGMNRLEWYLRNLEEDNQ